MAKTKDVSEEITKITPDLSMPLPDFLEGKDVKGLEELKQYVRPPYIKIVQKTAAAELLAAFGVGDVILSPTNAVITEMERDNKGRVVEGTISKFKFVPIIFWAEWCTWNPYKLKGQEPAIIYRTTDPNDPIVAKAKSKQLRFEPHPKYLEDPTMQIRHVEHLNFLVCLYEHGLESEPCVMSFSKGEHFSGQKFASLIKMRKTSLFNCVFEAVVSYRPGDGSGDWYGLDIENPSDAVPWVTEEEQPIFEQLHNDFDKLRVDSKIQAVYESEAGSKDESAVPPSDDF